MVDAVAMARGTIDWLLAHDGADTADAALYHGRAGILLALHEAAVQLGDDRCSAAVSRGVDRLARDVETVESSSLYAGLAGIAFTLDALGRPDDARRALGLVRERAHEGRWGPMFELMAGNAGIGLAAHLVGDDELAVTALTPYLTSTTRTTSGVNWPVRLSPARSHHVAHGTLGIAYSLALVGHELGRDDLVQLALDGAADVVARNEAGPDGFLVPHSDPQHRPDLIERYSFGWCNGPAGDAQVFRLLHRITGDPTWSLRADQCWHTITTSGLPRRLRPGFWDNHGRCCGTAGVLALALDRLVEDGDSPAFADLLVADLEQHSLVDTTGVRWSNHEHRADPPDLPPRPGWAMGSAGIVRELLRYVRVRDGQSDGYAVPWPDHPPTAG